MKRLETGSCVCKGNTFFNAKDICGFAVLNVWSLVGLSGYDEIQAVLSRECHGACSYQWLL
jgi:hypothetical protein